MLPSLTLRPQISENELLVGVEIDDLGGGRTDRDQRRADDRVGRGRRGGRPVGIVRGGDLAAEEVQLRVAVGIRARVEGRRRRVGVAMSLLTGSRAGPGTCPRNAASGRRDSSSSNLPGCPPWRHARRTSGRHYRGIRRGSNKKMRSDFGLKGGIHSGCLVIKAKSVFV